MIVSFMLVGYKDYSQQLCTFYKNANNINVSLSYEFKLNVNYVTGPREFSTVSIAHEESLVD